MGKDGETMETIREAVANGIMKLQIYGTKVRGRPRICWKEDFEVGTGSKLFHMWRQQ
jgi:hypothetical protein